MAKRIIICADGTWNRADQPCPTNVVKFALAIAPTAPAGTGQVVFYHEGVGTGNVLDRLTGGAFGSGLDKNIEGAYRFLMNNYDDGDEIFMFGFSRGAYTVRSTAGLLRNCGLLKKSHADQFPAAYRLYRLRGSGPDSEEAKAFREAFSRDVQIEFLGVWDTVGALGIPVRGLRFLTKGRYQFHDVELTRYVKNGYHALAIDERRGPFKPSLWDAKVKPGQTIEQVWFAGVHSDVGGGYSDSGLSDVAFMWMKEKAKSCGLAFDDDYINANVHSNPEGALHNTMTGLYRLTRGIVRGLGLGKGANEAVHPAAVARYKTDSPPYKPKNLAKYLSSPSPKVAEVEGGQ